MSYRPNDLTQYSTDDLRALEYELQADILREKQASAFWDFEPKPFQQPWWDCKKPIIGLLCGNQTGKTTYGVMRMLIACTGVKPKFLGGNPNDGFPEGICKGKRYLAAGEEFEVVRKETIVPKLTEFVTDEMLDGPPSIPATGGIVYRFRSGAELKIKSYKQHRKSFEGSVYNGAWLDEPPVEDIWTAVRRGLVANAGWIVLSATSLDEIWTYDQILEPAEDDTHPRHAMVAKFEAVMHDNCADCHGGALAHDWIEDFQNSISDEDEKAARMDGQIRKMEKVNFRYIEEKTHVVPDFEVHKDWPIVESIDPSMTRGIWCGWFTRDPDDLDELWYCLQAEHIKDKGFYKLAQEIKLARRRLPHEPDLAIMDQRGGSATIDKKLDNDWFDELGQQGLRYAHSVDRPFGALHDWLEVKWRPSREMALPKLRFFQSVVDQEKGIWWSLKRFTWDPETMSRHQLYNQKPKDNVDVVKYFATFPNLDQRFAEGREQQNRTISGAQMYGHHRRRERSQSQFLTPGGSQRRRRR